MYRQTRKLLRQSFKISGAARIFCMYGIFFVAVAIVIHMIDPGISTFGEALWYCFETATTIGFGDVHVVTKAARILTIILSVYSIAAVAIFTAVITNFFIESAKVRVKDSVQAFLDDLEHLPELSKEELQVLSDKIKKYRSDVKKG